jgi:hypothetical protein
VATCPSEFVLPAPDPLHLSMIERVFEELRDSDYRTRHGAVPAMFPWAAIDRRIRPDTAGLDKAGVCNQQSGFLIPDWPSETKQLGSLCL